MSFIQRELDRISTALQSDPDDKDYDRLYAAQQALAWALDPNGAKAPFAMIRDIQQATDGSPTGLPAMDRSSYTEEYIAAGCPAEGEGHAMISSARDHEARQKSAPSRHAVQQQNSEAVQSGQSVS